MFERLTEPEERGQVGIGTLIVFIALVLVAAIAAGVLINTAGFLQTQAEQTGEQSSEQVTDRLEPVETTGDVAPDDTVSDVDFVLQKSPGANDINVSGSTVALTGPNGTYRFEASDTFVFNNTSFQDPDGSLDGDGLILNDESDRLVLTMNLDNTSHGRLNPGEGARVEITGESGATTIVRMNVPKSLAGENTVTL
jgi:flagellin-like protein